MSGMRVEAAHRACWNRAATPHSAPKKHLLERSGRGLFAKLALDLGALQPANGLTCTGVYRADSVDNGRALSPLLPVVLCAVLGAQARPEILRSKSTGLRSAGDQPCAAQYMRAYPRSMLPPTLKFRMLPPREGSATKTTVSSSTLQKSLTASPANHSTLPDAYTVLPCHILHACCKLHQMLPGVEG